MRKQLKRYPIIMILLLCQLLSGCSFSNNTNPITKSGFYFNTVISITLYDASKESLLEDCFKLAETYENYFSNTIPDSDISKINSANGTAVSVHDETISLLKKGIYYGDLSGGKFDITIGNLSDLWDFSTKALLENTSASMIPSDTDIQKALSTVDYKCVQIHGNEVTLTNPDAKIDLGGIAKGYIADKMKSYLNENGVTSGLINLGGNVLVLGEKPDDSSYTIGIQKPFSQDGSSIASVKIANETVVSSGIYERYFKVDDVLYHHILDTSTGYPYANGLSGVTIITADSVDGDGLSTTCFALGLDEGMDLIESLPDTEAIFLSEDGTITTSSGIGTTIPYQDLSK